MAISSSRVSRTGFDGVREFGTTQLHRFSAARPKFTSINGGTLAVFVMIGAKYAWPPI
jgi:hypothetical protein